MEKEFVNEFGKTYGKVVYLSDLRTMVVGWHGYTTKLQIETVTLWVEQQVLVFPCDTIVNDCTHIFSVWDDSILWFSRIWLPKMKRIGLKSFLHIARPGGFGEKIGNKLGTILVNQLQFYTFSDRAEAITWLATSKGY